MTRRHHVICPDCALVFPVNGNQRVNVRELRCEWCGELFETVQPRGRFCCRDCQRAAYKARRRSA